MVSKLNLAPNKRIIPLAHNWHFDRPFLIEWLGHDNFEQFFDARYRDTMAAANFVNDIADFSVEPYPYPKVDLKYLTGIFKIYHENPHDALEDCMATAELYRRMILNGL